ncbi:hypothetical protein [Mesorhizobium marinum]|uniref:Uncharacterized protein n=1 Tax=Mesorhizobium marinum TaxID=3228790 RepID=A0ABV3R685_9HYPH
MAHEVILETNINQVVNKDVSITVRVGPAGKFKKLGKLLVSKGNIEWLPANNSVNKFRLPWTELAALLEAKGRKVKVP